MSTSMYVSCKCKSSCWDVFKFDVYAVFYFGSSIATRLRPLVLGCCKNNSFTVVVICLSLDSGMQLIIGIFFVGW
jgi:hypothetical protein